MTVKTILCIRISYYYYYLQEKFLEVGSLRQNANTCVSALDIAEFHPQRVVSIFFRTSKYVRAPMSPQPCKRVLLFFLISTNLTGEGWHLSVVLICISHFSCVK